jgi:hypothetical protein
MDLKEFIKESLVQISEGINEANVALESSGASVNPKGIRAYSKDAKAYGRIESNFKHRDNLVHMVSFDVALHAEAGSESGGGLKLSIASIGANANTKSKDSEKSESLIKFEIPMKYPSAIEET